MVKADSSSKSFAWTVILNILGKPLNMLSLILIAHFFGTSSRVDAYFWVLLFFNNLQGFLLRNWQFGVVQTYAKIKAEESSYEKSFFCNLFYIFWPDKWPQHQPRHDLTELRNSSHDAKHNSPPSRRGQECLQ